MKIKDGWLYVEWEISDGYCSGRRTHTTKISVGDILECDTVADVQTIISEAIQEDFEQKVTWSLDYERAGSDVTDFLAPDGWAHRPEEYDRGDAKIV